MTPCEAAAESGRAPLSAAAVTRSVVCVRVRRDRQKSRSEKKRKKKIFLEVGADLEVRISRGHVMTLVTPTYFR